MSVSKRISGKFGLVGEICLFVILFNATRVNSAYSKKSLEKEDDYPLIYLLKNS